MQKWQGLDPMIGIRATGIYTTLSNAGMEPQSIGGSACWMIGIRSTWGLHVIYGGLRLGRYYCTRNYLHTASLQRHHFFSRKYTQCIHLLIHANAMLDRTSALDYNLCFLDKIIFLQKNNTSSFTD